MEVFSLAIGALIGATIIFLILKQTYHSSKSIEEYTDLLNQLNQIQIKNSVFEERINNLSNELSSVNNKTFELEKEKNENLNNIAKLLTNIEHYNQKIDEKNIDIRKIQEKLNVLMLENDTIKNENNTLKNNQVINIQSLEKQKEIINNLNNKFTTEFENIANKILEQKTEKFTNQNKTQLEEILKPLGENILNFKQKVEEVYDKESKERFSLGERVKELTELNQKISQEAHNLTNALRSDSKKQGNWGEMILETILERSGLVKNVNYFMEVQLKDEQGNNLRSDSEDKKMRPDAIVKYPDNRSVIIDSKVSLNAYSRYVASDDINEQEFELKAHINAIKNHIITLSNKGYDDFHEALDFVMMFVPTEPAYLVALQHDIELWNFAYEKRILLISPTNLITSLKLIEDLWKREYQNKNAIEIAERGGKLYDKFVGFVTNLSAIGDNLDKAQLKYKDAFKQLTTGSDNLVRQAEKLKQLGVKSKRELPLKSFDNELDNKSNENN
jgi:DNA recombination protein RmuC